MNREQKYRYCLFDGKARLHFLCVLCYVGWIRVINCELCESKQVLHAIFKEILHSLTWTVLFSVLGFCTVFVGGLVFGYQRCGIYYLCDLERPSSPGANLEYLTEKKKHETDEFFRNAHQQNTNPRRSASQKSDPQLHSCIYLEVWGELPRKLPCELTACGHNLYCIVVLYFMYTFLNTAGRHIWCSDLEMNNQK